MKLPRIPLFDWLIERSSNSKLDLANSSITGVPLSELLELTNFEIPKDLNLGKNDPFGAIELRQALANIYKCDPNQVVPTTGGSEANFLIFLTLVEPGDEVIVEQPGYSPLWLVPEMLGARIIYWERKFEDGFALDIEALKNKITNRTKLVVITNLHNPSGVVAGQDTIKEVAEIASDYNSYLFIDEMFLDIANEPQRTALGLDSVIITASVSKIYGISGLRTGWIIAPKRIAKQCLLAKWQASVAATYFSELLSAAVLSKARDKLIKRCKDIAMNNFPIVQDWMEKNEDILDWVPPAGGIMCYPKYKTSKNIDSLELCERIFKEKGILISPGSYFGRDGHFRLSFMNPEEQLKGGLTAIEEVLKREL